MKKLAEGVLVLDGAMGTMIEAAGASGGCNEELNLKRPDIIGEIHRAYLEAGADIVTTNTFGASRVVLADHGLEGDMVRINLAAARIAVEARDAAGDGRFVAGELGPTSKLPTLGHISFFELEEAYRDQARALLEGGVDLLIAQTCQDPLQAKAAASAWRRACGDTGIDVPFIVSVTIEPGGTMLLGTEIRAALTALAPYGPSAFGINCGTGPGDMEDQLFQLSEISPFAISCQPNAGMPENVDGRSVYNLSPGDFSDKLADYVRRLGVGIVGGCCGTTPDHIAALSKAVEGERVPKRPDGRRVRESVASLYTSYALDQEPRPFIVAEQTNVNGSKRYRELLERSDYEAMADVGRRAAEQSHALDICVAATGRDEGLDMSEVVSRLVQRSQVPIMIDSMNPDTTEAALAHIGGRAIINSINLEDEAKAKRVMSMARRFGAALVALTIDEEGMAKRRERKVGIAKRVVDIAREEGLDPSSLIIDALTFTLAGAEGDQRGAAAETLAAIREIKAALPEVKTVLGVSNVSFGLPATVRPMVTSVFLTKAIEAGLDAAIINPARIVPIGSIPEDMLDTIERLIEGDASKGDPLAEILKRAQALSGTAKRDAARREPGTPAEALGLKVMEGSREGVSELIDLIAEDMEPRKIINGVLLPAMQRVGEEFGAGRMPLPFVLQSAETMRFAIDLVSEGMKGEGAHEKGTIVLATVRGDVHDIGKNLVDAILANNGFRVVNLGIKQGANAIMDAAKEEGADAIGLSGLLVSSTEVMREDLAIFREAGLVVPVLCGGAALNSKYVDEILAGVYGAKVVYCRDAFAGLTEMERICRG